MHNQCILYILYSSHKCIDITDKKKELIPIRIKQEVQKYCSIFNLSQNTGCFLFRSVPFLTKTVQICRAKVMNFDLPSQIRVFLKNNLSQNVVQPFCFLLLNIKKWPDFFTFSVSVFGLHL